MKPGLLTLYLGVEVTLRRVIWLPGFFRPRHRSVCCILAIPLRQYT